MSMCHSRIFCIVFCCLSFYASHAPYPFGNSNPSNIFLNPIRTTFNFLDFQRRQSLRLFQFLSFRNMVRCLLHTNYLLKTHRATTILQLFEHNIILNIHNWNVVP
uniref:Putative secreted protein n=1 Tax=Panstrongylus lignarius TaxID=156445 RepID=A0A224Y2M8_9HEMI